MKIALDNGGSYLEPDDGQRTSKYHMRIVRQERIPNTRVGNHLTLSCGHGVQAFGNLDHAKVDGEVRIFCTKCRDMEESQG